MGSTWATPRAPSITWRLAFAVSSRASGLPGTAPPPPTVLARASSVDPPSPSRTPGGAHVISGAGPCAESVMQAGLLNLISSTPLADAAPGCGHPAGIRRLGQRPTVCPPTPPPNAGRPAQGSVGQGGEGGSELPSATEHRIPGPSTDGSAAGEGTAASSVSASRPLVSGVPSAVSDVVPSQAALQAAVRSGDQPQRPLAPPCPPVRTSLVPAPAPAPAPAAAPPTVCTSSVPPAVTAVLRLPSCDAPAAVSAAAAALGPPAFDEDLQDVMLTALDACVGAGVVTFRGSLAGVAVAVKLTEVPVGVHPAGLLALARASGAGSAATRPTPPTPPLPPSAAAAAATSTSSVSEEMMRLLPCSLTIDTPRAPQGCTGSVSIGDAVAAVFRVANGAAEAIAGGPLPVHEARLLHIACVEAVAGARELAWMRFLSHPNIAQAAVWHPAACMQRAFWAAPSGPVTPSGSGGHTPTGADPSDIGSGSNGNGNGNGIGSGNGNGYLRLRPAAAEDFRAPLAVEVAAGAVAAGDRSPICLALVTAADLGSLLVALQGGLFGGTHVPTDWRALVRTLHDIAMALRHMHALGIAHRALSPAAVQLSSCAADPRGFVARLGELGLAARVETANPASPLAAPSGAAAGLAPGAGGDASPPGSPAAPPNRVPWEAAPEGLAEDVKAFGQLMWSAAHGGASPPPMLDEGRPRFRGDVPLSFQALAEACWAADPGARPSAREVVCHLAAMVREV
ncbi:hypothetical protein HYH03_002642 [Edaphochlamys debaryana]|uniref:Protein kinase domain-containing protein n=1 Tax=Edaphochlamys debaryana TaxID=47281 RepID=A0A836C5G8_9CHLO|nr:hypothetical protein HYH03_002642 [Edaphochlamys debaryana]|eukprot:KAG2499707.1 hypothetical protein HYH03_002642 [Edaphochlamys debaryana]